MVSAAVRPIVARHRPPARPAPTSGRTRARPRSPRGYLDAVAARGRRSPLIVDRVGDPTASLDARRRARAHRRPRPRPRDATAQTPHANDLRRRPRASTTSRSRSRDAAIARRCRRSRSAAASRCSTSRRRHAAPAHPRATPASRRTAGPASRTAAASHEVTLDAGSLLAKVMGTTTVTVVVPSPPGGRQARRRPARRRPRRRRHRRRRSSSTTPAVAARRAVAPRGHRRRPIPPANASSTRSSRSPSPDAPVSAWSRRLIVVARELVLGDLAARVAGHDVDDLEALGDLLRHEARRRLQWSRTLLRSSAGRPGPSGTTNATTISPRSSSGMPSTATSAIFGCA